MLKRLPQGLRNRERITPAELQHQLRYQIVGRLHTGWLRPGDRLPSIRDVASEAGVDHRVVADAYRLLEKDGLVEIRATAGAFVASPQPNDQELEESASWVADILLDAWERRISRSSLCDLFGGVLPHRLRCGCIESNEDHMVALRAEIEAGFSLESVPLFVQPEAGGGTPAVPELHEVDLVVTSVFHAEIARALASDAGKPAVVVTLHKKFTSEIDRRLKERPITTIVADRRYADRARAHLALTSHRDRVHFLVVEELNGKPLDLADEGVLLTRAARRRLGLAEDYHLIPSPPTLVSTESAREICRVITRLTKHRQSA